MRKELLTGYEAMMTACSCIACAKNQENIPLRGPFDDRTRDRGQARAAPKGKFPTALGVQLFSACAPRGAQIIKLVTGDTKNKYRNAHSRLSYDLHRGAPFERRSYRIAPKKIGKAWESLFKSSTIQFFSHLGWNNSL